MSRACWHKQTPLHSTRGDQEAASLETGLNAARQQVLNRGWAGWRRGSHWLTSGPATDQPRSLSPGFILRCSFLVYALENQAVGKIQKTEIGCFLIPLEDPSKALGGLSVDPHNGYSDDFIIQTSHATFPQSNFISHLARLAQTVHHFDGSCCSLLWKSLQAPCCCTLPPWRRKTKKKGMMALLEPQMWKKSVQEEAGVHLYWRERVSFNLTL